MVRHGKPRMRAVADTGKNERERDAFSVHEECSPMH